MSRHHEVVVIGAGVSGICAAIKLIEADLDFAVELVTQCFPVLIVIQPFEQSASLNFVKVLNLFDCKFDSAH